MENNVLDAKNTPVKHFAVFLFALAMVLAFRFLLNTSWSTSFGRASFFLLFLILIIGPVVKIRKPSVNPSPMSAPWTWRGELGIWFAIASLAHFIIILIDRPFSSLIRIGGSGYSLTNLLGLVALIWTLALAAASFRKIIIFLGIDSWKWLNTSTYVIFYLVSFHFIYFQFFSTHGAGPDWFGYSALLAAILVIILQLSAFTAVLRRKATAI
ncbi:MAG: hypothetical protein Q8Q48_04605 [Candidatus Staskawiczbacteria bacterium]|nr:hypothetical protein [Candidatus Staskawiczbacteria bacterium]